uniref:Uncharacterized protein n=1 Tax=Amphimedon queenslandica TaxID=400682 RepID=A0A1X7UTY5_AMPQE
MQPVLGTTSISTAILASSKASATPVISVTPISKSSVTTTGESSVTTSYESNVTVFVTTT